MHAKGITRRASLLLPFVLAACAQEQQAFPPLRYDYLPPIGLNVAKLDIRQDFIPSGIPPDVTRLDPEQPSEALRAMAEDRLKPLGSSGYAVFAIRDASMVRHGDTISGSMAVVLSIYPGPDTPRAGFAEARVTRDYSGRIDDLPARMYDMTKQMMQAMNVEFEYQLRRTLKDWLVSNTAAVPPVQAQPLGPTTPPPSASPLPAPPPSAAEPANLPGLPPPAPMPQGGALSRP